jgi:hypothetical protein
VLGLGGPVFALIEAPTRGWHDPLILVSLVRRHRALGAFVSGSADHDAPMLPLRLFRLRNFTFANVETFAVYAALSTLTFFLVLFLQQLAGYSPSQAGSRPCRSPSSCSSSRRASAALDASRPTLFMGSGRSSRGALLWMRELSPGFDYWTSCCPACSCFAVGLSLIVAPLTSTVLADAGERDAGSPRA